MRIPLALTCFCLLAFCTTSRRTVPAAVAQVQQSGAEAAVGYAVSFDVIDELMDVVDVAHAFYRAEGHWPVDSTALVQFARAQPPEQAHIDPGKYQHLDLDSSDTNHVTINFRLSPYTVRLDEQEGGVPVNLQAAAGRIGITPFSQDSANVRVDLDELRFATTGGDPLEGDLSGAAMDFKVGRRE